MASMVTVHPFTVIKSNNLGMAVISFDFSETLTCPKTKLLFVAHALTMWKGDFFPLALAPLMVFPSIGITSPSLKFTKWLTQSAKQASNCSLSMDENTRLNVSSDGIPLGNSRNERKKPSFALAYVSMFFHVSAAQTRSEARREGNEDRQA